MTIFTGASKPARTAMIALSLIGWLALAGAAAAENLENRAQPGHPGGMNMPSMQMPQMKQAAPPQVAPRPAVTVTNPNAPHNVGKPAATTGPQHPMMESEKAPSADGPKKGARLLTHRPVGHPQIDRDAIGAPAEQPMMESEKGTPKNPAPLKEPIPEIAKEPSGKPNIETEIVPSTGRPIEESERPSGAPVKGVVDPGGCRLNPSLPFCAALAVGLTQKQLSFCETSGGADFLCGQACGKNSQLPFCVPLPGEAHSELTQAWAEHECSGANGAPKQPMCTQVCQETPSLPFCAALAVGLTQKQLSACESNGGADYSICGPACGKNSQLPFCVPLPGGAHSELTLAPVEYECSGANGAPKQPMCTQVCQQTPSLPFCATLTAGLTLSAPAPKDSQNSMPVPMVQTPADSSDKPLAETVRAPATSDRAQDAGRGGFPEPTLLIIAGALGLIAAGFGAFVFGRRNGSGASQPIALTESDPQSPQPLVATGSGGDVTGSAWTGGAQVGSGDGPVSDPQPISVDGTGDLGGVTGDGTISDPQPISVDGSGSSGFTPVFDESGFATFQTSDGSFVTEYGDGGGQVINPSTGVTTNTSPDGSSESVGPGGFTYENSVGAGETSGVVLNLDGGSGGAAQGTVFFGPDGQAPLFIGLNQNNQTIESITGQIDANGNATFSFIPTQDPVTGMWSGAEGTTVNPLPMEESGGTMDNVIVNGDGSLTFVDQSGQTTTIGGDSNQTTNDGSETGTTGDQTATDTTTGDTSASSDGPVGLTDPTSSDTNSDESSSSDGPVGLTDPVDSSDGPQLQAGTHDAGGGGSGQSGGGDGGSDQQPGHPADGDSGPQQQTGPTGGVTTGSSSSGSDSASAGNSGQSGASDAEQGTSGGGPVGSFAQQVLEGFDKHPGGGTDSDSSDDYSGINLGPGINEQNYLTGGDSEGDGGSAPAASSSTWLTGAGTLQQDKSFAGFSTGSGSHGGTGGGAGSDDANTATVNLKPDGGSIDTSLGEHNNNPIKQAVEDAKQAVEGAGGG